MFIDKCIFNIFKFYFFQVLGLNKIKTGKISSLPINIAKVSITFEK